MASRNGKYDQATIDRAVSMVTGGEGRRRRTLRDVADELGIPHVVVHRWVHRAARQAPPDQTDPSRKHHPKDLPQPIANAAPIALEGARQTEFMTDLIEHQRDECKRLSRENAALKATVVLLARDLDERE